jgi:F-type H+-transporting ATPase subunit b
MYAGKVRFGFIPDEWFTFFYNKTGVTGPYAFGAGLLTWLLSKEIWVLEHEFWGGVSFFIMIIYGVKKFGPKVSAFLDKEQQNVIDELNSGKVEEIRHYNDAIAAEKRMQFEAEGSKMLFDVKKENVGLQLEAAYRQRIMEVYSEVKKRLDYQVEKINVERAIQQKHMVNWIIESVKKAVAAESDQENLKKCIADLKGLAARQ